MTDFTTKLDAEDERRNLWAQVMRGLFGIIRIMENYVRFWTTGCPTNELRRAAERLNALAAQADAMQIHDLNQPTYDFK